MTKIKLDLHDIFDKGSAIEHMNRRPKKGPAFANICKGEG